MPTAAQRIVQALVVNGVDHVFCVPGESYLAVLDALADVPDKIRVIACRHEAGAANMAEAYGKLTGRPGVAMVTRGPGATHASVGVHTAQQDSTPMILLVGQVARAHRGRGAFQEVDYRAVFGTLAKWADEIDDPNRIAEVMERAFAVAQQGRQGPVVLAMPEDMLAEPARGPEPRAVAPARAGLDPESLAMIGARLERAERPVVILGGSGWGEIARDMLDRWLWVHHIPTVLSFRRKDLLDNTHASYVGDLGLSPDPKLIARIKSADLVIALGARLGENPSQGYTLFTPEETAEKLVHIHPGPEELGRVWPAAVAACADVSAAALALVTLDPSRSAGWRPWLRAAKADYDAFSRPIATTGRVNLSEVVAHMAEALPEDAIVCNGAGNFAGWLHRFYRHPHLPHPAGPDVGRHGLRPARGGGGQAGASGAGGGLLRRRRGLPDDRPGAGHRGPVRRPDRGRGGRQRLVRHHPRASGAALSGAGDRHRPEQPRLRRLRPRLRLLVGPGRADRAFPRRPDGGAQGRGAGPDPPHRRPGRHRAGPHPERLRAGRA